MNPIHLGSTDNQYGLPSHHGNEAEEPSSKESSPCYSPHVPPHTYSYPPAKRTNRHRAPSARRKPFKVFCPRKTPENPNHDKKRRNIPNVLSRVCRPRSEVIEPFELHSSIVRGGRSQRTASVGILEFPRITSNGRDQKTVSVETDSTPGIHPRVPRAGDELPEHIGRIALPLRRVRRRFYHFRIREGPCAPPSGVLFAPA